MEQAICIFVDVIESVFYVVGILNLDAAGVHIRSRHLPAAIVRERSGPHVCLCCGTQTLSDVHFSIQKRLQVRISSG